MQPLPSHASVSPSRRRFVAASVALLPTLALAQGPAPLRLVVTFGVGGIADVVARLVAGPLAAELGQPVVVENRTGASGTIGAQWVAQAPADGQTLLVGTPSTQLVNPLIYARLPYDPVRDFVPVSLLAESPVVMVSRPLPGLNGLAAWTAHAQADPGRLNFASAGAGTTPHLGMELFKLETGTDILHVPYRSGAEAAAALLAGTADLLVEAATVVRPFVQSGQMQALCAPGPRRCAALPHVATSGEQGLASFAVPAPWFGLMAPDGTPAARVAVLQAAAARALAQPTLRAQLMERGIEPMEPGARAYQATLERDLPVYQRVVRAARITAG